ncbi:MAG: hypothetical protein ACLTOV_14095 [Phocaeicola sp.]
MKKKNHYIQQIISYFFHHDVSDEMRRRFYNRMLSPTDDANRDEALKHIWDTLDASSCTDEMTEQGLGTNRCYSFAFSLTFNHLGTCRSPSSSI